MTDATLPNRTRFFARTSIGKKVLMAVSGLFLFGFVVAHLIGNLQVFLGQDQLNAYGVLLRAVPEALWGARIFLLLMVVIHVWTSVQLTLENRRARPEAYAAKKFVKASYASRTMHVSGLIVLAYVVYHLMHFTWHTAHPQYAHFIDAKGRHDIYSMVVLSFRQWPIALVYVAANFLLCQHLSHGISSLFQTLGLNNRRTLAVLGPLGVALSWLIFIGYASIPLAALLGILKLPAGVTP